MPIHPSRVRADAAEKFKIASSFPTSACPNVPIGQTLRGKSGPFRSAGSGGRLHSHVETGGSFAANGKAPALNRIVAELIAFVGNFTNGRNPSAVGRRRHPRVDLQARRKIADAGLSRRGPRDAVVRANPQIIVEHKLKIDIVEQADLDVEGSDIPGTRAYAIRVIECQVRKIHFQLKMSGIDRVRTLGFVRSIRSQLAQ